MRRKYEFHMPDGSIINSCIGVDRYYNLGKNTTRQRLKRGWTEEECANNKRVNGYKKYEKYEFHMPDGSVIDSCRGVDKYYNLKIGLTNQRLLRYNWTEEECANNKRAKKRGKYEFHMPDGSILTSCRDVDRYYNLNICATRSRLERGWAVEECANNKRGHKRGKYKFHMPDGSIINTCSEVDEYYKLSNGITRRRLRYNWTEEECANNIRNNKYKFHMPDGSIITSCRGVDRYYGLCGSTTRQRLGRGWSIEECAKNKRDKKYEFHMPDGSIIMSCTGVDRYYNLGTNVTHERLKRGWTEEECANNKREGGRERETYEFHMPDGSVLTKTTDIDRYYNLGTNVTYNRLRIGWTIEECANNKRNK